MSVEASQPDLRIVGGWGDLPEDTFVLADLLEDSKEGDWQLRALCAQVGSDAWFPEIGDSTREAKRVCLNCEVRDDCLEYALTHDIQWGIWGGFSVRERRKLKKGGRVDSATSKQLERQVRNRKIQDLRKRGVPVPQVAALVGVSTQTVTRVSAGSRRQRREKEAA